MKKPLFIDWRLIIPVLVILGFSLSILASISPSLAWSQAGFIVFGSLLFILFSRFNYQNHIPLVPLYSLVSLLLLILPFIFGVVTRGSVRWLQFGSLTLQPSEIIKPFLVLIFSFILVKKLPLYFYLLALIIPAFLIFKQPDLGSALVVTAIWLGMLLSSEFPLKYLIIVGLSLTGISPVIYKLLKPYQQARILSFLNPYADPKGTGFNVIQSMIAIGSGKLFGRGLGSGTQSQLMFLPERHSDFIFATLAEELGFLGALVFLVATFFLLKRILDIAQATPNKTSRFIIIGIFSLITFQVSVNVLMNLGLLPITGITLPLLSAGGSSMLATMIALGIVHNISSLSKTKQTLEIK